MRVRVVLKVEVGPDVFVVEREAESIESWQGSDIVPVDPRKVIAEAVERIERAL